MTIVELARDIEAYQTDHPEFNAYDGTHIDKSQAFLADIDLLTILAAIAVSDGNTLNEKVVTLSPFGQLIADLFEPHWANAQSSSLSPTG